MSAGFQPVLAGILPGSRKSALRKRHLSRDSLFGKERFSCVTPVSDPPH